MEGVGIGVLGIDAVSRKSAAQAVGTVVHGGDGFDDFPAVDLLAGFGKNTGDCAAGGDAYLSFFVENILAHHLVGLLHLSKRKTKKTFTDFRLAVRFWTNEKKIRERRCSMRA